MGVDGAVGHVVEFAGPAIEALSMEGRMTVCNMTIEGGGRAGMIAPDEITSQWVAEHGAPRSMRRGASCRPTTGATFDKTVIVDCRRSARWSAGARIPAQVVGVADVVPEPQTDGDERALHYMGLDAGTPIQDIKLDRVFIGSCTNSRIGDLRAAAAVIKGRKVSDSVYAMVVPGSVQVKAQAEREGLDKVFTRPVSTGAARAARCAWE